jgi:hypothetical protein
MICAMMRINTSGQRAGPTFSKRAACELHRRFPSRQMELSNALILKYIGPFCVCFCYFLFRSAKEWFREGDCATFISRGTLSGQGAVVSFIFRLRAPRNGFLSNGDTLQIPRDKSLL